MFLNHQVVLPIHSALALHYSKVHAGSCQVLRYAHRVIEKSRLLLHRLLIQEKHSKYRPHPHRECLQSDFARLVASNGQSLLVRGVVIRGYHVALSRNLNVPYCYPYPWSLQHYPPNQLTWQGLPIESMPHLQE